MFDFLTVLSLMRKLRKMESLTKKILKTTEKRQACMRKGEEYTRQYEELKLQCKRLKKTGYPN